MTVGFKQSFNSKIADSLVILIQLVDSKIVVKCMVGLVHLIDSKIAVKCLIG